MSIVKVSQYFYWSCLLICK